MARESRIFVLPDTAPVCLILSVAMMMQTCVSDGAAASFPTAGSGGCSDDMGCSLNGKCQDSGCICDPAWTGPACARLAVLPTERSQPAAAYGGDSQRPNISSWGGNVLRGDDGVHHLWVSEFVNGCGLSAWLSNSQVAHATASTAVGPFAKHDTSLGIFSHNVVPTRAPKTFGTGAQPYYLFHLGTGHGGAVSKYGFNTTGAPPISCSNRSRSADTRTRREPTAAGDAAGNLAHRSPNPHGPWEPLPSMWPVCNNPAPVWHPNGTLFVACNNGQSNPWPLFASTDGGFTWTKAAEIVVPPTWTTIRTKTAPYTGVEDPFLYFDARGHWHLLVHRYRFGDGPGIAPSDILVAGHGYSLDGWAWEFSSVPPFDSLIQHHTGPATPYTSLERPKLRIDEITGQPTHLIVAASPAFTTPLCAGCRTRLPGILNSSCVLCKLTVGIDSTFTVVLPLRTSPGPPPPPPGCTDDLNCSLAGACIAGVCHCEPWTKGHDCAALNLAPLSSAAALTSAVVPVNGTTRWGGSVVDDRNSSGLFHLFGAEFAHDCSLDAWGHQSRVYHAVGDNATGPFTRLGVAVGTEAHNPVMTRDPVDGTWLLFTMGCPYDNSKDNSCAKTNVSCGPNGIGAYWTTTVYSSVSLNGPWEPHVDILGNLTRGWFSGSQNVAPMFSPNGSITLMFKGTNKDPEGARPLRQPRQATPANIATAPHWRGPYTLLKYDIFGQYVKDDIVTEDCFLWRQPAGTFQALCHRGVSENLHHWKTPFVGGHAFARTLDDWRYAATPSYTTDVPLISGGSLTIGRRERPQIFLGSDGAPSVLYNAVRPHPNTADGLDFTFAQKLGGGPYPPCPPPSPSPSPPGTVCDPATFVHDMEFDDGLGLGEVRAATAAACCAHCATAKWAAKGCKWFSFIDAEGRCFLKADDNSPLSKKGVTSGATHT